MAVERDVFGISGPTYLKSVDWNCEHNRRSVAASLVQAVYVLERDRQLNRQSVEALAPPWWEFFHFELIRKLIDDADMSIFGAIFEFNPPSSEEASAVNAPRFVIAFRGTITERDTISRDLSLDIHLVQNGLHRTSRFTIAMQAVRNVASVFPGSKIWLAGHSLGAGMAILTGRNMVKKGVLLESFLFNPPFVAAPIERIRDEKVKHGFRIARSVITAGLTIAMKGKTEGNSQRSVADESFSILSSWTLYLYVNPGDHICSEYIGYFQHRKNMEGLGAGFIEKLATQNSIGDLFFKALGWESEPLHLLPSADLIVNVSPSPHRRRGRHRVRSRRRGRCPDLAGGPSGQPHPRVTPTRSTPRPPCAVRDASRRLPRGRLKPRHWKGQMERVARGLQIRKPQARF